MKTKLIFVLALFLFAGAMFAQKLTIDSLSIPGLKIRYLDGEKVYVRTDSLPIFPGGNMKMFDFIKDSLKYIPEVQPIDAAGRVVIGLVVSKTGDISNYEVVESVSPALDAEALRVVMAMPKEWRPAILKGNQVNAYFKIPISFKMEQPPIDSIHGAEPARGTNYSIKNKSQPEYPGGEGAMHTFIRNNLKYPKEAENKNIQGKLVVQVTVQSTGEITDFKIIKSVHPLLDKEALRVAMLMPKKWIAAEEDGHPVNASFKIPMFFRLTEQ